jgi:predicted CoA-binding protein
VDPYRKNIREELDYIKRKKDAGADGFFTQPFFDLRLMDIYAELLEGSEIFWGVSPVTGEKSVNYWETKNNVVFPKDFEPTLAWNIDFAQKALAYTEKTNTNIYFMPIRTDLENTCGKSLNNRFQSVGIRGNFMTTRSAVQDFLNQKTLAVIGVSRSKKKFSRMVFDGLRKQGYKVFAVNPNAAKLDEEACFDSISSLPQKVDGIVIIVSPKRTEKIVEEAFAAGIKRVWMQNGAETKGAIDFCKKNGITVIDHQCIFMFLQPKAFPHNIHGFIWKLTGKMPK